MQTLAETSASSVAVALSGVRYIVDPTNYEWNAGQINGSRSSSVYLYQHSLGDTTTLLPPTMSCFRSTFHAGIRLQPASRIYFVRSFSSVHDVPTTPISAPPPPAASIKSGKALSNALQANSPRNNWTKEEISEIYNTPLIELQYAAVCSTFFYFPSAN